jgi:gas vesicle protein
MSGRSGLGFLAGIVLGALTGAVCGILFAPRSGEQNREALLEKVPELRTLAPRVTDEVKARLDEGREAYREAAAKSRQRMTQELEETQRGEVS